MSIKATLRWHLMSVNLAKIKDIDDSICWSKGKTLPQLVRVRICSATLEISMVVSQKLGINLPQDLATQLLCTQPKDALS